jgi:predicted GNAT superfamily acetyltransferase
MAAEPAVCRLDRHELSRLMGLSLLHLAATRGADGFAGYVLAFFSGDDYDGEEFLQLRSSIHEPFVYVDEIAVESEYRGTGIAAQTGSRVLRPFLALTAPAARSPPST